MEKFAKFMTFQGPVAKVFPLVNLNNSINRILSSEMAFILGVGRKTDGQPRVRFAANFGLFIQS